MAFSKLAFQRRQVYYGIIWGRVCFFICLFVFRANTKLKGAFKMFLLSLFYFHLFDSCLFVFFNSQYPPQVCWTVSYVERYVGTEKLPKADVISFLQRNCDPAFLRKWKLTGYSKSIRKNRNCAQLVAAYKVRPMVWWQFFFFGCPEREDGFNCLKIEPFTSWDIISLKGKTCCGAEEY